MRDPWRRMTPSLLRIVECLSRGLDTREIAFELNLADKTVHSYVKTIGQLFDVLPGRDIRVIVAIEYFHACQNDLFRIGCEVMRSQ